MHSNLVKGCEGSIPTFVMRGYIERFGNDYSQPFTEPELSVEQSSVSNRTALGNAQSTTTPKGEEDDPWSDTPEDAVRRRQLEMATGPIDPIAGW